MEKIPPEAGTTRPRQLAVRSRPLPRPCCTCRRRYLFLEPEAWGRLITLLSGQTCPLQMLIILGLEIDVDVVLVVVFFPLLQTLKSQNSQSPSCFDFDFLLRSEIFQSATKPFKIYLLSERGEEDDDDEEGEEGEGDGRDGRNGGLPEIVLLSKLDSRL